MPNVYQPGLLQIRPQYDTEIESGDTPENVVWFLSNTHTTPSQADLTEIQATFDTFWAAAWAEVGSSSAHYTGSVMIDWSSATGLESISVGSFAPIAGATVGLCPPQVAALVSYLIPLRWRGGHFRTYLPYVSSGVLAAGLSDTIRASSIDSFNTAFNALITNMSANGVLGGQIMVVYKNKTNPATAETFRFFAFILQPLLATQRRRIRRVSRR